MISLYRSLNGTLFRVKVNLKPIRAFTVACCRTCKEPPWSISASSVPQFRVEGLGFRILELQASFCNLGLPCGTSPQHSGRLGSWHMHSPGVKKSFVVGFRV